MVQKVDDTTNCPVFLRCTLKMENKSCRIYTILMREINPDFFLNCQRKKKRVGWQQLFII